ncbi:unnamed protein product [Musa acuminata subsp. malaccensis]|uniref:(wild Malaysian banana) hypothetical protein n=1 Tax=Musa acuminata subsp. malaccensis TaxID=214687 RepID=A0A804HVQ2_MUSAM|nr:PREDICTED: cation transporter HKT8 [Musa acuminata subsp. malaccensis]CAG1859940.1 unnamed protein product [Musa acuminata subsp. malaccensis]
MAVTAITSHTKSFIHKLSRSIESIPTLVASLYRFLLFQANPFWIQSCYFFSLSMAGFLLLKILPLRDVTSKPTNVDLLFMSASANTVSSMDAMEMEVFSNYQLGVLTLLMVTGGEVFVSLLGLHFAKIKSQKKDSSLDASGMELATLSDEAELGHQKPDLMPPDMTVLDMKSSSRKHLFFVVLGYLIVAHVVGFLLILVYLRLVPDAGTVLDRKGINASMFSIFTTVSTFANCGFVLTNENMVVFRTCSGLLLIVIVQALVGNTMYASSLRAVIWLLKKLTKRQEYDYLLNNYGEMGYDHLLPGPHALYLAITVAGLVLLQLILFCCMEWTSDSITGLSTYQKIVGAVFMSVNSRYAGESIVDLSAISPAILVLFVVMMYLPPYTCFLPREDDRRLLEDGETSRRTTGLGLILSPLSSIAIFTIIICITERRQMSRDPLNFSVLNVVVEVVSAYGTVGYTTGYSCKRQVKADVHCKDVSAGFSAKWSNKGKLVLIAVMFFGRLKKFSMGGGKYWQFI